MTTFDASVQCEEEYVNDWNEDNDHDVDSF